MNCSRRRFLQAAGLASTSVAAGCRTEARPSGPPGKSALAIVRAESYSKDLVDRIERGVRACGLDVRGKRVLLKPNLVEFEALTSVNTHVSVAAAAYEVLARLGAAEIVVGEGPGHRRDTMYLATEAGYRKGLPGFERRFVDLNRDDVTPVKGFADWPEIYLPNSALAADLIVSLPKMKTHHWAGATLSLKNLFGMVPGAVYGWPKNPLHFTGIERSIAELYRLFPRSFAIVDGIVGMQGNGPIQGTPKNCGVLVMGHDLVAVDATCCRIMGIDPEQLPYLQTAAPLGHVIGDRIEQRGETIQSVRTNFDLIQSFRHARLA